LISRDPEIELHTDVRRNHGAKDSDVLRVVHAKKDEHQRIVFAVRSHRCAQQKSNSADEHSSHPQVEKRRVSMRTPQL
jgi:hypothetical protein